MTIFGQLKRLSMVAGGGALMTIISACGATAAPATNSSTPPSERVPSTVNVGYFTNPNPEKVAMEKNWFQKDTKTHIHWVPLTTGAAALSALASGAIDIASAIGNPAIATAVSNGINLKVIWVNENSAEALVAKSGINSVSQLVGKNVGVAFGSTSDFTLIGALNLHHIPLTQVHIVDMAPTDQVAAWNRGDIQAAYVWQPFLGQMLASGGHIVVSSSQLAREGYPVFDAVVVNGAFAKKYPSVVQGFVDAEQQGTLFYEQHPNQSYQLIAKAVGITPMAAQQESTEYTFPNAQAQVSKDWLGSSQTACSASVDQGLKAAAAWLLSSHSITTMPTNSALCNAVDPSFAETAQKIK